MTDKEKIIAEIERLMKWKPKAIPSGMRQRDVINIRKSVLLTLKEFINSLPAEQPSEDLEEEISNYIKENFFGSDSMGLLSNRTNGELDCIDVVNIARYFANWQKEQMMKNCLYNTEVMLHTKQNNTEYLTLANDKLPHIPISLGLNVGDKVKVIIVNRNNNEN